MVIITESFKKSYKGLLPGLRKRVRERLLLLAKNINHPSLKARMIEGTSIWEVNLSGDHRFTFSLEEGQLATSHKIILRTLGDTMGSQL